LVIAWLAALPAAAADAAPADDDIVEVVVEAERRPDTAVERHLDRAAVTTMPARSADELLRAIPGMHLSSHGGRGKALQFMVRGFDAEHGSDVLVTVEGVPLNEPSNVHGQGYLDLHFLPGALVQGLDLVKGSYGASDGDFAITGAADYEVGLDRPGLQVTTMGGSDRTGGGTVAWRPRGAGPDTFALAEAEGGLGVGEGRQYAQARGAVGVGAEAGGVHARALAFAYDGQFASPGVLRADDLERGAVDFYGAYPEAGGGRSRRVLGIGALDAGRADTRLTLRGWAGGRTLSLDQNYTGYLRDPAAGDGTRQAEQGATGGVRGQLAQGLYPGGHPWTLRAGFDLRHDRLSTSELAVTPGGAAVEDRIRADVRHTDAALWADARLALGDRLTLAPGIRADRIELGLRDALAPESSGSEWARSAATVVLPKATASLRVADPLTLFAAGGRGFRSPDARAVADGDLLPVMVSDSAELGARLGSSALGVQATAFGIQVGNELVFDHLTGRFASAGRTRRVGIEAVVDARPLPWLRLQADATLTDARFVATGEAIPFAPRAMVAAGAYAEGARIGEARLTGGVRAWALGQRPLPSGFVSHPALVGSATGGLEWPRLSLGLEVDNLFSGQWRDGEFVFPSWFDQGTARSERPVLHVTAGDPFAVRFVLGFRA
jgi:iron complex outermembrane recepter protein